MDFRHPYELRLWGRAPRRPCTAGALLLIAASACDSPGGPMAERDTALALLPAFGNGQEWFTGEPLPSPVGVAVRDQRGAPVGGVRVGFAVLEVDGVLSDTSALTSGDGVAGIAWRLGPRPGIQRIVASIADRPTVTATLEATAHDPATAVHLAVTDPGAGSRTVVFVEEGGVDEVLHRSPADTLVRLVPRAHEGPVVAFAAGHPPVAVPAPWSGGSDTTRLAFGDRHRIAITVWVYEAFEASRQRALDDIDAANALLTERFGVNIATVRVVDATELAGVDVSCTSGIQAADPGVINVYYARITGAFAGYACSARTILMRYDRLDGTRLLAHELGHAFSLRHANDPSNIMHPRSLGTGVYLGQVFAAHFRARSALNAVYRLRPESEILCHDWCDALEPDWLGPGTQGPCPNWCIPEAYQP